MPIEFSDTGDDALCPNCDCYLRRSGYVLEQVRNRLAESSGVPLANIGLHTTLSELGVKSAKVGTLIVDLLALDSLDVVELVMALEEEFDLSISDEDAQNLSDVGDLLRYLRISTVGDLVRFLQARLGPK